MKFLKIYLLLCITSSFYAQSNVSTEYFRHLRYNHVSPYINLAGTFPIDKTTAESTSHYIFKYDVDHRSSISDKWVFTVLKSNVNVFRDWIKISS